MKGDAIVLGRLDRAGRQGVAMPQPVLAELAYGLSRLPRSKRKERLRRRFDRIRGELARSSWTDEVSERFGEIKAELERRGARVEDFDLAIAAHALAAGATLVTANLSHMARVPGIEIQDWASGETTG
ncbi:MAG: PIN domain-containing protein [Deltaproteobacteria bacterium]|nr:PIN domain-containing protein [Deltaproteobacteria bacterium]